MSEKENPNSKRDKGGLREKTRDGNRIALAGAQNLPNGERNESRDSMEHLRQIVGVLLSSGLWFLLDLTFVWPESHEHFWWFLIAWLIFQLIEASWLTLRASMTAVGIAILVGIVGYRFVPPTPPHETATHGYLVPAYDPTPKNACRPENVPSGALLVIFGSDAMWSREHRFVALRIGDCTTIEINRTAKGLAVDADVHAKDGKLVARIEQNEFHLVQNEIAYQERKDRSTIVVVDPKGSQALHVRYVNPSTLNISGRFYCTGISVNAAANRNVIINSAGFPDFEARDNCIEGKPIIFEPHDVSY